MKYEITNSAKVVGSVTLHRIRALRDIPLHNVKKGDIGGFIEKEPNLCQEGDCWVGGDTVQGREYIDARGRAKLLKSPLSKVVLVTPMPKLWSISTYSAGQDVLPICL